MKFIVQFNLLFLFSDFVEYWKFGEFFPAISQKLVKFTLGKKNPHFFLPKKKGEESAIKKNLLNCYTLNI
jgi:hypothetical protein